MFLIFIKFWKIFRRKKQSKKAVPRILEKIRNPTFVAHGTQDILIGPATGPNIVNAINAANNGRKIAKFESIEDGSSRHQTTQQNSEFLQMCQFF